jgi:antitoxin ParD1/3/4/toxin ParE1/3/4
MKEYELHPGAYADLDEIAEYIGEDSADAAKRVADQIFRAIAALVPFPHRGHRRSDLTSRPLRFWRVYDYLIAYAPDERPLWVVAVMHGQRSPRVMAAILRSREARVN